MKNYILLTLMLLLNMVPALASKAGVDPKKELKTALQYFDKDDFPNAMIHLTMGMEAAESQGDLRTQVISIGYIGNVYFNVSDFGRAQQYLHRGFNLSKELGDERLTQSFLTNIISTYCKMGDAVNARRYLRLLGDKAKGGGKKDFKYFRTYDLARIAFAENRFDDALKLHTQTIKLAENDSLPNIYLIYQYCEIGEIYFRMGDYAKALEYGRKCLEPALAANDRDFLVSVYKLLGDSYAMLGDDENGDKYQKKYLALSDSVFNRDRIYAASNDLMDYEARRTSSHIMSLNRIINRQIGTIIAFIAVLVALALLSTLLWRNNRKLKKAQKVLVQKGEDLRKQEKNLQGMLAQLTGEKPTKEADDGTQQSSIDKEQANRLLQRIMAVMDDVDAISNPEFNLNMLAETVKSNTKYVSQVINDMYGKNFKTLLNESRIREASKRLTDKGGYGRMTIQAVYESVGYTNSVSFIRAFKNVNGMTPSEFQKASKEAPEENEKLTINS